MAKKRKTKEQKKLADLRHTFTHSIVAQQLAETKVNIQKSIQSAAPTRRVEAFDAGSSYRYLITDLSKTAILTGIIVAVQLAIFFALKNHILTVPGLSY